VVNLVPQDLQRIDVLIGGAGFAGLALAIALRQALGPSFSVAVADPALARDLSNAGATADGRASAIVAAVRRLFETLGIWEKVADQAQPILDMAITDSRLSDAVRPTFLTFGGEVAPGEPFGHMIENAPLLAALAERARAEGVTLFPSAVTDFDLAFPESRIGNADHAAADPSPASVSKRRGGEQASSRPAPTGNEEWYGPPHRIDVELSGGEVIAARLLVGADGARSAIRKRAGITSHGWSYDQSSIVTTVAHERDHNGRAEEHFLPAGPFAILPLKRDPTLGPRSSIVWTEEAREAERIVALPDDAFHAELERRFGLHLGEIKALGPRRAYPLGLSVARTFIAERLALVGDAAHLIHPIAGQGLNMGLKDVAALAEVIVDAVRLGLDPGSLAVLDRYQRWRRFDTMAMGVATDGLNRLFSNRSDALRLVRDVGLGLVDRLPALKRLFIREAAGLLGEVPKLLRGEAL
jgi:2-octaprenyl-6-methoxyphenol hydroxylase